MSSITFAILALVGVNMLRMEKPRTEEWHFILRTIGQVLCFGSVVAALYLEFTQ